MRERLRNEEVQTYTPYLVIGFFEDDYAGERSDIGPLCVVEGSCVPFDRSPFSLVEEARHILEQLGEKYATPSLTGDYLTVAVVRKIGTEVIDSARMSINVRGEQAHVRFALNDVSLRDAGPVALDHGDDVVTIVTKVLRRCVV